MTLDEGSDLWFPEDPAWESQIQDALVPGAPQILPNPFYSRFQTMEGLVGPFPPGKLRAGEPWWTSKYLRNLFKEGQSAANKRVQFPFQKLIRLAPDGREISVAESRALKKQNIEVVATIREMTIAEMRRDIPDRMTFIENIYISGNQKTFWSFNQRIGPTREVVDEMTRIYGTDFDIPSVGGSCRPTEWCMWSCYAKAGRISVSAPQRRLLANHLHMMWLAKASQEHVNKSVDAVYKMLKKAWVPARARAKVGRMNMRMFGSGDLTPGSVRWINTMAQRHPDLLIWGMTRRADLIDGLCRWAYGSRKGKFSPKMLKSIAFQVSVDPSSPFQGKAKGWKYKRNPEISGRKMGFYLDQFVSHLKKRGWTFCYATHLAGDPFLQGLRAMGIPLMTVFGFHRAQTHTDIADFYECPATNPKISKYYEGVEWGDWYTGGYIGGGKAFAICQVCKWCMTSARGREKKLGKDNPAQTLLDPYFNEQFRPAATPPPPVALAPRRKGKKKRLAANPTALTGVLDRATVDYNRMPAFMR
jgi:hypothetical protein